MAAAQRLRRLCASGQLHNGGAGLRFEVERDGVCYAAFAVRHEGVAYAYLNRCAHIGVELDWQPGQFFDAQGALLICSTHGALYDPRNGKCVAGPCKGASLAAVELSETDGFIHYSD